LLKISSSSKAALAAIKKIIFLLSFLAVGFRQPLSWLFLFSWINPTAFFLISGISVFMAG
jgi:hypothetical protein